MPTVINGLPAHVLLIHVIVVLAPLGALFTVLSAGWPAAHRKLGFLSPLTCLIVLIFVPIATHAGEWLQNKLDPRHNDRVIERHASLGHTFVWFAIGLFIVSTAVWLLGRRYELTVIGLRGPDDASDEPPSGGVGTVTLERVVAKQLAPTMLSVLVFVVALVMSVAAVWQLYRIGDSGAQAAWSYVQRLGK